MALTFRETKAGRRPGGGYPNSFPTRAARPLNTASQFVAPRGPSPTEGRTGRMATAGKRSAGSRRPLNVSGYPTTSGRSIISTTGGLMQGFF